MRADGVAREKPCSACRPSADLAALQRKPGLGLFDGADRKQPEFGGHQPFQRTHGAAIRPFLGKEGDLLEIGEVPRAEHSVVEKRVRVSSVKNVEVIDLGR
jgi:hypothetical protein